ncbi:hypothetical protein DM860_010927 [Cuscuta australis]|uniref:Uncharacterized protein n=1 Tax=Cuscuta australis TaxID=267555 RepID=A0A328E0A5_9ASTE|nr:hypothetical protein DM860_010927 [Cuscuta australis]
MECSLAGLGVGGSTLVPFPNCYGVSSTKLSSMIMGHSKPNSLFLLQLLSIQRSRNIPHDFFPSALVSSSTNNSPFFHIQFPGTRNRSNHPAVKHDFQIYGQNSRI